MTVAWSWDDLRIFLAAMRTSSLRKAAESLGVSHPTARRRLKGLEEHLGLSLFERRVDGLHATPEARSLLPAAEAVERAIDGVDRAVLAADPQPRGRVRVALAGSGFDKLMMPLLTDFALRWPEIELVIEASNAMTNLDQREADVAVRLVRIDDSPPEDLAGRKAGVMHRAVYGTGETWIGWYGDPPKERAWLEASPLPDLPVRGGIGDPELQALACRAELGLAWLPCFLGADLPRRTKPQPEWNIWVLVHPDLRRNPRLRMLRDHLVEGIRRLAPILEGTTAT